MIDHWDECTRLADTVMMKVRDLDDDGMDVYFTGKQTTILRTGKRSKISKAMKESQPKEESLATDMTGALGDIFDEYYAEQKKRKREGKRPRKLTIYVFTDGIWGGTQQDTRVDDKIRSFVNKMINDVYGDLGLRRCTIQFIHFGDNQYARERLQRLDDELQTEEFPNFPLVDTRSFLIFLQA